MTNKVPILATCAAALCPPLLGLGAYFANAEANTPPSTDGFLDGIGYAISVALVAPVALTGLLTGVGLALRTRAPRTGFGLVSAGWQSRALRCSRLGGRSRSGGLQSRRSRRPLSEAPSLPSKTLAEATLSSLFGQT